MSELVLHGYFRSGAAHRVRIALNLKGLAYAQVFCHLRKGEQHGSDYLARNPQGLVPFLEHDGTGIAQSMAIIEYLDETFPTPPLLPAEPKARARVRSLAQLIACDIHPLNNLRVLLHLKNELGQDEPARDSWARRWIGAGFAALETRLASEPATGRFCHGDAPGLADCLLVPQVVGAGRYGLDLEPYPTIRRIASDCEALPAFVSALPANQPDAE